MCNVHQCAHSYAGTMKNSQRLGIFHFTVARVTCTNSTSLQSTSTLDDVSKVRSLLRAHTQRAHACMLSQRSAARCAAVVVVNFAWAVNLTPRTVMIASRRIQQATLHGLTCSSISIHAMELAASVCRRLGRCTNFCLLLYDEGSKI